MKEHSEIFNELTEQEIELISPFFEQKKYAAESFLFREGEPSDSIYFIVSGKVEMTKQTDIGVKLLKEISRILSIRLLKAIEKISRAY